MALVLQSGSAGDFQQALPAQAETWFRDFSKNYGVEFKHSDGTSNYAIGSGAAWFDMDNDGDEDLFVQDGLNESALYRRDGTAFVNVIETSGIANASGNESYGATVADYDGDGLSDLYLLNVDRNTFFENQGGGQFLEMAIPLGLAAGHTWSTSGAWADFDLDGDLDVYVGNYVTQLNFPFHYGAPNNLFENRGPSVSPQFEDVAVPLGVDDSGVFGPGPPSIYTSPEGEPTAGCTLGIGTLDYDEDGDPDIQVGNDFGVWVLPDAMFRNDQSGGAMLFTDVSAATGFDTPPHYNMGIYPSDYDHDGDWDFYKTNIGDNVLLQDNGGIYTDVCALAGPTIGSKFVVWETLKISSWGVIFEDLDNDTWDDLMVVNGNIPAAGFIANINKAENSLWKNNGDGTFREIPPIESGMADKGAGRSVARADMNGDGLLDYYVQNNGGPFVSFPKDRSRLYVNVGKQPTGTGNWLELDLEGRIGHPDAFGSRLDLTVDGVVLKRQLLGDSPFLAANSRMVHFGLGPATEAELLTIHWHTGIVQTLRAVQANQRTTILEPTVTGEGAGAISYAGSTLSLAVDVTNHDDIAHSTTVTFEVVDALTAAVLYADTATVPVPAGTTQTITADQSVPPGEYALVQGSNVELRTTVTAAGADDQDAAATTLP